MKLQPTFQAWLRGQATDESWAGIYEKENMWAHLHEHDDIVRSHTINAADDQNELTSYAYYFVPITKPKTP